MPGIYLYTDQLHHNNSALGLYDSFQAQRCHRSRHLTSHPDSARSFPLSLCCCPLWLFIHPQWLLCLIWDVPYHLYIRPVSACGWQGVLFGSMCWQMHQPMEPHGSCDDPTIGRKELNLVLVIRCDEREAERSVSHACNIFGVGIKRW